MSSRKDTGSAPARLIAGGDQGSLTTPVGEKVPVRVFERDSDLLMLVMLLASDTGMEPEPIEPMLLEYTSVHGLVRVRGEALLENQDLIRFHSLEDAEVLQRREFVRIDAPQPVLVEAEEGSAPVRTHALDVSGGGMLLRGLASLELGTSVRFRLELGAGEPTIEGRARVVRAGDSDERGVVFEQISSANRQRLIRFIFDRQRAALAKTRGRRR